MSAACVIPCVLQAKGSQGWGTLDRFPSMTDAIADAKALTFGIKQRTHFRLLDGETMEPISYFDTIGAVVHASEVAGQRASPRSSLTLSAARTGTSTSVCSVRGRRGRSSSWSEVARPARKSD